MRIVIDRGHRGRNSNVHRIFWIDKMLCHISRLGGTENHAMLVVVRLPAFCDVEHIGRAAIENWSDWCDIPHIDVLMTVPQISATVGGIAIRLYGYMPKQRPCDDWKGADAYWYKRNVRHPTPVYERNMRHLEALCRVITTTYSIEFG